MIIIHQRPQRRQNKSNTCLQFHFILNVAVGGVNFYWPDDVINRNGTEPKPWSSAEDTFREAVAKFWDARGDWYKWWTDEVTGVDRGFMEIDYIRVYEVVDE